MVAPRPLYPKLLQINRRPTCTPRLQPAPGGWGDEGRFPRPPIAPPSARCTSSGAKPCWPRSTKMAGLGVHWNRPDGGISCRCACLRHERHRAAAQGRGAQRGLCAPAPPFYADNADQRTCRPVVRDFDGWQIATGIAALAAAIREHKGLIQRAEGFGVACRPSMCARWYGPRKGWELPTAHRCGRPVRPGARAACSANPNGLVPLMEDDAPAWCWGIQRHRALPVRKAFGGASFYPTARPLCGRAVDGLAADHAEPAGRDAFIQWIRTGRAAQQRA